MCVCVVVFRTKPRLDSLRESESNVHPVSLLSWVRERGQAGQLGRGRREEVHRTLAGRYPHILLERQSN